MDIKSKLLEIWENNPPSFFYINLPLPNSPSVMLDGGGSGNYDVEVFIKEVEFNIERKQGDLWSTQTFGHYENPDHEWYLVGYEALDHPVYQKLVILYYVLASENKLAPDSMEAHLLRELQEV